MRTNARNINYYSGNTQQQIKVNLKKENKALHNTPEIIIKDEQNNNNNIKLNEMILKKIKKIKPNNLFFTNSYFNSKTYNISNNPNNINLNKNNNVKNIPPLEKQYKKITTYKAPNKNGNLHKKNTSQNLESSNFLVKSDTQYEYQTQIINSPDEINKYIISTPVYNKNDIIINSFSNKRRNISKKNILASPESNENKINNNTNNSISKAEKKSINTYKSCYNFYNDQKLYNTKSFVTTKNIYYNKKKTDDEINFKKSLKYTRNQKSFNNYFKNNLFVENYMNKVILIKPKLVDEFCYRLEEFIFYNVKKNFDHFIQNLRKVSHKRNNNNDILLKRLYNKPSEKNFYKSLSYTMSNINPKKKSLKNSAISPRKMVYKKNAKNGIFNRERNTLGYNNNSMIYIPKKLKNEELSNDRNDRNDNNSLRKTTTSDTYIKKKKIVLNENLNNNKNQCVANKRKALKNSLFSISNNIINNDCSSVKMEKLNQTNDDIINAYIQEQKILDYNSLNKIPSNKNVYFKKIKPTQNKNKLHKLPDQDFRNLSPETKKYDTFYTNNNINNKKTIRIINIYSKKNGGMNKSPLIEKKNYLKEIYNDKNNGMSNKNDEIIKEIIVKDVSTRDKRLNVYIKYVSSQKALKIMENQKKINSKYINGYLLKPININSFTLIANKIINKNISNKTNFYLNNFNKNKLHKILTAIIEEEERSKAPNSVNNSMISNENNKNYSNYFNQSIKYITNYLQNILYDKKRNYAYEFIKILKKIKNTSFLNNLIAQKKNCVINENKINGGDNGEVIVYGGDQIDNQKLCDENNFSLLSDGEGYCHKRERYNNLFFGSKNGGQNNLNNNLSYVSINDLDDKESLEVVIKKVSKKN